MPIKTNALYEVLFEHDPMPFFIDVQDIDQNLKFVCGTVYSTYEDAKAEMNGRPVCLNLRKIKALELRAD